MDVVAPSWAMPTLILQCAIYAGVPAANAAFHMAEEVFREMEDRSG
jgi:alkylhydroperoxidase/carboxymuconolactone decarboxylase family protein YurZ